MGRVYSVTLKIERGRGARFAACGFARARVQSRKRQKPGRQEPESGASHPASAEKVQLLDLNACQVNERTNAPKQIEGGFQPPSLGPEESRGHCRRSADAG